MAESIKKWITATKPKETPEERLARFKKTVEIVNAHRACGLIVDEAARRAGTNYGSYFAMQRMLGVSYTGKPRLSKFSPEQKRQAAEEWIRLRREGLSEKQAWIKVGHHGSTLRTWCEELGINHRLREEKPQEAPGPKGVYLQTFKVPLNGQGEAKPLGEPEAIQTVEPEKKVREIGLPSGGLAPGKFLMIAGDMAIFKEAMQTVKEIFCGRG